MKAKRRTIIKSMGTLPIAALAGCLGGGLEVESVTSRDTVAGNVIVTARVTNDSSSPESGTLLAEVDVQNGEMYTHRKDITVDGDGSETFEIKFDIPMGDSLSGFQYDYDAKIE